METSTSPTVVSATASLAPPPQERRGGPLRWLTGFGPSGLLGLAVLLFWLLAALLGPWLLSHSTAAMSTSSDANTAGRVNALSLATSTTWRSRRTRSCRAWYWRDRLACMSAPFVTLSRSAADLDSTTSCRPAGLRSSPLSKGSC